MDWFSYSLGRQHAQGGPSGQGIAHLIAFVAVVFGLVAGGFTYWNGFRLLALTIGVDPEPVAIRNVAIALIVAWTSLLVFAVRGSRVVWLLTSLATLGLLGMTLRICGDRYCTPDALQAGASPSLPWWSYLAAIAPWILLLAATRVAAVRAGLRGPARPGTARRVARTIGGLACLGVAGFLGFGLWIFGEGLADGAIQASADPMRSHAIAAGVAFGLLASSWAAFRLLRPPRSRREASTHRAVSD